MTSFGHSYAIALYFLGFVTALITSVGLTYVVREEAKRRGLFDPYEERKLHTRPTPRIGGLAIASSVALTLLALSAGFGFSPFAVNSQGLRAVLAGAAAIHVLGLWDDRRPMPARWKLLGQVVIATVVYFGGARVSMLSLPGVGVVELWAPIGLLITVAWFVGVTNAFNLIDGLDGLASGAAMFALTTMFVVGSINGQVGAALVTIVIAGATLGFLFYNWHPASIFLGDSGSLFLGFMLAGIGLLSSQKGSTVVAVAIPVVALGLPVLDTLLAIVRRFLRGQPIFTADRGHIHHRLLGLGHSPRKVAMLLYGGCAVLALGGMLMVNNANYTALLLLIVGLGVGLVVQRLRFHEFEELARAFRRGLQSREVIARRVRIREASSRMATLMDLEEVFTAMRRTFEDEEFQRAEVRLRQTFLNETSEFPVLDRRLEDDTPVWAWSRNGSASADWWEIKLPLLDVEGGRIGSLVLWQDGDASETSLSHMHAIAGEFRTAVQTKLLALWRSSEYGYGDAVADIDVAYVASAGAEPGRAREWEEGIGARTGGRARDGSEAPREGGATANATAA
ncbi:MAG TPA: MraY family glycosyltransferase [Gemmatimonadaceae bacterium]|nr:MraY family glycosyltransferase [Gemmatimonadaceae bacterium]